MVTVMGIDQSLTSTGVCIIDQYYHREEGLRTVVAHTEVISTEPTNFSGTEDTLVRATEIASRVFSLVRIYQPSAIRLEAPTFASKGNATRSLAILFGYLMGALWERSVDATTPTQLKKFATGKGNATKLEMFQAIQDKQALAHISKHLKTRGRYDVTDAYFLALHLLSENPHA